MSQPRRYAFASASVGAKNSLGLKRRSCAVTNDIGRV